MGLLMSQLNVAFLINLDRRPDRWLEFKKNSTRLEFLVERFPAVDGQDLSLPELRTPPAISACWMSHQDVAKKFLMSDAKYCLVLEDDVELTTRAIKVLNQIWNMDFKDIDLLQIGFCINNNQLSNRIYYRRQLRISKILKQLNLLERPFTQRILENVYGYKIRFLEKNQLLVAENSFELGTHAYLISRKFAKTMINFNRPVFLPADLAMMEIVKTGKLHSFRLIESLVNQSRSPSSISNASLNSLEKKISLVILEKSH